MAQKKSIKVERIINYEKVQDYYSNCVMVNSTNWDFCLLFGRSHLEGQDKVVEIYERSIYLSPQQAKALLNILGPQVAQFEKNFGEIEISVRGNIGKK